MILLGLVYKMNRPDPTLPGPTRPDRDAVWRLISRKVLKIRTRSFYTVQVFDLWSQSGTNYWPSYRHYQHYYLLLITNNIILIINYY